MRYQQVGNMRLLVVPRCDFDRPYFSLLRQLAEAQNWRCCFCGIHMQIGREGTWTSEGWRIGKNFTATIEHVVPKAAGGSNEWDNLAASCRLCNNSRGAMRADKYLRLVGWKGREKAARYANRLRAKLYQRKIYIN